MSTPDLKWSLYNPRTDVQIDGLKLSQAQSIVANLNIKDVKEWKAWHEGLADWQTLSKFSELLDAHLTVVSGPQKTVTVPTKIVHKTKTTKNEATQKKSFDLADDDFEKTSLKILEGKAKEARMNSRFTRSYDVKVLLEGMAYSCKTLDISMGGMRIDKSLPTSVNNAILNCELSWGAKKISLSCRVIPDPKSKGSSRLVIRNLKDPQNLRSFLLEGS